MVAGGENFVNKTDIGRNQLKVAVYQRAGIDEMESVEKHGAVGEALVADFI